MTPVCCWSSDLAATAVTSILLQAGHDLSVSGNTQSGPKALNIVTADTSAYEPVVTTEELDADPIVARVLISVC